MIAPHVLLVEDSDFMATRVVETLETVHDFFITSVGTAEEAREALAAGGFDCIVSNYQLPDETGIELAASLANDETGPSIPLIILTGRALEPIASDAIEAGVTEFVYKGDHATGEMDVLANRIKVVLKAYGNR